MKTTKMILAAMLLMVASVATATNIPLSVGTYLTTSESVTTGNINNNDKGNLGSIYKGATATFTLTNTSAQEMVLTFLTGNDNDSHPTVAVTANDGDSYSFASGTVAIEKTAGSWTPSVLHVFDLGTVPAGTISLTFAFDNESSYVGNLGSIGVYNKTAYIATLDAIPCDIDLTKGTYNGPKLENSNTNVGYVQAGGTAIYPIYNNTEGAYDLKLDIYRYNAGGTLNVKIVDLSTGEEDYNDNLTIASDAPSSYTTNTISITKIKQGFKTMKFTFSDGDSYICNYKNVKLEYKGVVAEVSDYTIAGQTVTSGTTTDYLCNLPVSYGATTTFAISATNGTIAVTAVDDESSAVTVTDNGDGTYSVPTPDLNHYAIITTTLTPNEGASATKTTYTLKIFRIGEMSLTGVTVDGVSVDVLATINSGSYSATYSACYTTAPTVAAVQIDGENATVEAPSISGSTYTYAIHGSMAGGTVTRDYTLVLDNVHVYAATGDEESVNIKANEGTIESNVWTNGIYTFATTSLDSYNEYFKWNGDSYTISLPADDVVKQLIFKDCSNNYAGNNARVTAVTSAGATVYIPVENKYYHDTEGSKHDIIVNIEGHTPGTDIVISQAKSGQPMAWIQLTVVKQDPGTAPASIAQTATISNNDAVVAVTFDREIANDVTASIAGQTVKAKGGSSVLYFPVWDLPYSSSNTLTIAAGGVTDNYSRSNASAIEIAVNIPAKAAVAQATYDYVVSNTTELQAAFTAVKGSNNTANAARKTIFVKNGTYDFGRLDGSDQYNLSFNIDNWHNVYNVSLIGESKEGVIITGNTDGIKSATLNLGNGTGIYLQDLTVRNDYRWGSGNFRGVSVAITGGKKAVLKNVAMQSYQDTYVTGDRTYLEDCDIYGTVDFICGGGDIFFEHNNLILCDPGDVIVAPNTNPSVQWGYVLNHCIVKANEGGNVTDGSWHLGRPWQNEPRAYFLNTDMQVLCATEGWKSMSTLVTHFYEFNTLHDGSAIDLSGRTNSPTSTNTYTPVLTAQEAAEFTVHNVLGGTDAWDAQADAAQVAAPQNISANGRTLKWNAVADALLYVILKDGEYVANTTATTYNVAEDGVYTVKAANKFGGLGEESASVTISTGTYVRAFANRYLNTLCFPYQIDTYTGATFYTLQYKVVENEEVTEVVLDEYEGALVAGTPYFYVPNEGADELVCNYSGEALENPLSAINGVQGIFASQFVPENDYVTYQGKIRKVGDNVTLHEYRAYIHMADVSDVPTPVMAGRKRLSIRNADAPQSPMDYETVQTPDSRGQKILRNGQLLIIRDGKAYNVLGKMIK